MQHYNLITEPWIDVEMMDGSHSSYGVREVLQNSEQVRTILPPTFRGKEVPLYEFLATQFLSAIVMAAHYKPENGYMARDEDYIEELMKNGVYDNHTRDYLDRWYDRFDLFSEDYPFMQDLRLRKKVAIPADPDKRNTHLHFNPLAPGANNRIFREDGEQGPDGTRMGGFRFGVKELAYILLHTAAVGFTCNAKNYPNKSLSSGSTTYLMPMGGNLAETVAMNCIPLGDPYRDGLTDRPVWEMDDPRAVKDCSEESLLGKILLCMYFPSFPCLVNPDLSREGLIQYIADGERTDILPQGTLEDLRTRHVELNPWAVHIPERVTREVTSSGKVKENVIPARYYTYQPMTSRAYAISITATGDAWKGTPLVLKKDIPYDRLRIFYRVFKDKYKSSVQTLGVIEFPKDIRPLLDKENNDKAIRYQRAALEAKRVYDKHLGLLSGFQDAVQSTMGSDERSMSGREALLTGVSDMIERDFLDEFLPSLTDGTPDPVGRGVIRLCSKLMKSFETEGDGYGSICEYYIQENGLRDDLKKVMRSIREGGENE